MSHQPPETPTPTAADNAATAEQDDAPATADARDDTARILDALRDHDFLAGLVDARDVSLIYIDRHQVNTYLGPDRGEAAPHRGADTAAATPPPTRI
ncbi:MAG: hypothetical protein KDD83_00525, partial [Caldilineaceae bacterium]|nr:hypothetical protein [Caldilineaceae bacterium]